MTQIGKEQLKALFWGQEGFLKLNLGSAGIMQEGAYVIWMNHSRLAKNILAELLWHTWWM